MSRVGKNPVSIPSGVSVREEGRSLVFSGRLGVQVCDVPEVISYQRSDSAFVFSPKTEETKTRALWGTVVRNVRNAIKGVSEGFSMNVELVGVGYRAAVANDVITLQLGYSHDVVFPLPDGVQAKAEKPTLLVLTSNCKQQLGHVAAMLRSYRPPEPYKGKGVIRNKEFVLRKEGKKK